MSAKHHADVVLSPTEKLRVAGYTAPRLRGERRARPVNVVAADGTVIGQIDRVEVVKKLHERIGIEFDVDPDHRDQIRNCKSCGKVFVLPPKRDWKEHAGRLPTRCQACRNAPCRICGAEATPASKRRGDPKRAVCAQHVSTGPWCAKPVPPCAICGEPAAGPPSKARYATVRGRPVYCDRHRGGPVRKMSVAFCEVCGVKCSVAQARFCSKHRATKQTKPRLPCTVCGAPSKRHSNHLSGRSLPYCEQHKGGTTRGQFAKGRDQRRARKRTSE